MTRLCFRSLLVGLVAATAGCANIKERDAGNSENGLFYLGLAPSPNPCGPTPTASAEDCARNRCWMLGLEPGRYQLQVTRWIRIADCNGLGDCLHDYEHRPVGDVAAARLEVVPEGAATVDAVSDCDGALQLGLTVVQTTDFSLALSVGSDADTWTFRSVADCAAQAFDCDVYAFDTSELPPRCCGYASNPPR